VKGHGAKLERKQEETIAALLTQRNIEEGCAFNGVAPNTLLNWMKVPELQNSVPGGSPRSLRAGDRAASARIHRRRRPLC